MANGWLMEKTPHDIPSHTQHECIASLPLASNNKKPLMITRLKMKF